MILGQYFEPVSQHTREYFWTTTAIQKELSCHLKSQDLPSLRDISESAKKLRWRKFKNNGVLGYYLSLRS
jgi:hypothetical protein